MEINNHKHKTLHKFIIGVFISLYVMVSIISVLHIIEFFELSNSRAMAITLSLAFEVGAMASLLALVVLDKIQEWLVVAIFVILTAFQAMGNVYASFTYIELENIKPWIELFGLTDEDIITQKRIIALISGLPLPIIALGFIKSLIDYLRPQYKQELVEESKEDVKEETKETVTYVVPVENKTQEEAKELVTELKSKYSEELLIEDSHEELNLKSNAPLINNILN